MVFSTCEDLDTTHRSRIEEIIQATGTYTKYYQCALTYGIQHYIIHFH